MGARQEQGEPGPVEQGKGGFRAVDVSVLGNGQVERRITPDCRGAQYGDQG